MLQGEFESMQAIAELSPNFVPHPIYTGIFASDKNYHFMLSQFCNMEQKVPKMELTCAMLAKMHRMSHEKNVQQFGFPITTYNGNLPQDNTWCQTWEQFYAQQLRAMLKHEEKAQGPHTAALQNLFQNLFDKVIPRLLRPMETGGYKITPSLIHGDFWDGNVATKYEDGAPVTYDAGAFWGHNEYDIRTMAVQSRYVFGPEWQAEYLKYYPPAHPRKDFEGRSALYLLRSKVHDAALFANDSKFRTALIEHAQFLVENYGEGYESWLASQKEKTALA